MVKFAHMIPAQTTNDFDVIIIGGGITGTGTARDCALRGLRVLLVERDDIATGATGRNHGLLHSGARYAVKDSESAEECIRENTILRKIAAHCVEDTQGLFITLPEDEEIGYGLDYQKQFIDACTRAGIKATAMDPREAIAMEPSVNPALIGAVQVPDGSVDPFRLCSANLVDAKLHGAKVLTYHEFVEIIREGDTVRGVRVRNKTTGQTSAYFAPVTVNAAGIWGHQVAEMAGVHVGMYPAKGALLIFAHRVNNVVINRCRKSADGDILVPGDTVSVIGTTSTKIPFEECDDVRVTPEEVDLMLREGSRLAPSLMTTRVLRAYAGVRPLVSADNDPTGRNISRGIVCLDHEKRDGLRGFITITGGKLMTYRLMAEMATDAVCEKLGVTVGCSTATTPLPGSESSDIKEISKKLWKMPTIAQKASVGRVGTRASQIKADDRFERSLVCECEQVSVAEVRSAMENLDVHNLVDLRRRTRVGMGTCQGQLCACRAAGLLGKNRLCVKKEREDLASFMEERWKGLRPVAWGDALRGAELSAWEYSEVLGFDKEDEQ